MATRSSQSNTATGQTRNLRTLPHEHWRTGDGRRQARAGLERRARAGLEQPTWSAWKRKAPKTQRAV
eukprot:11695188-Alexandrium_andersonii.AAC.1